MNSFHSILFNLVSFRVYLYLYITRHTSLYLHTKFRIGKHISKFNNRTQAIRKKKLPDSF